jgi:hypothetical protein
MSIEILEEGPDFVGREPSMSIGFASIVLNLSITSHGDITLSFSHNYKL